MFTEDPIVVAGRVLKLKYDLMAGGANERSFEFHANQERGGEGDSPSLVRNLQG